MTEPVPAKETKAQRTERLKLEKNPWQAFDEVRAFAREGRSSVLPEWTALYFKWWGVYTQGDGVGAIGGKGGERSSSQPSTSGINPYTAASAVGRRRPTPSPSA